jgi:photosystem II stability/assembly factor-like uncharacterized protein
MKQNAFLSLAIALLILFSCKKDNAPDPGPGPGPVPGNPTDTLGTGWKKIQFNDSTQLLGDIFFVGNTGFCISPNTIYKSIDAGNNWTGRAFPGINLYNLGMGSDTNAIFIGSNNGILVTHNGGISYDFYTLADPSISDVFFVNTSTAYIAGKSIWKTTNAGNTWTKLYEFAIGDGYKSLHFINDQIGWVIKRDGLFKTTNGGVDWQLINTGTVISPNISSVFFPDESHGYISDQLTIASTSNAGSSWTKSYTGTSAYHDIHFVSANTGYITDNQYILKTIDGGLTWNKEVSLSGRVITELHFTDSNHGWACGSNGTLLKYEK